MRQIFKTLFVINSYFGGITSVIESSFVCLAPNGKFQHHICSKYWHCVNNIPHKVNCEESLLWNDFYKVCDWPQNLTLSQKQKLIIIFLEIYGNKYFILKSLPIKETETYFW